MRAPRLTSWRAGAFRQPLADPFLAVLVGCAALGLYLRTLLPGLGGPEDTPKFQFLGYVLGTAHPPGYPLYVMLTHLFSYVPVGTLAFRMNLFSAVCASLTVALVFLIARELPASRLAAAAAALGLACGQYFWWNAVLAEVYALGAVFVAAAAWWMLRWSRTRRPLHLHLAAASVAIAVGNHLTIVALAPALVLVALLVDPRAALRPRTLLVNALILAAGWLQYGYIMIRTAQGAPFLESRAHTVAELLAIIRAERFASDIGGISWGTFLTERVPFVFGHLVHEMGVYGLALVVAGLLILGRARRPYAAVLLGTAAAGAFALAAWVAADIKGFLIPVVVLAWPAAAPALDAVRMRLVHTAGRAGAVVALVTAAILPAHLAWSNFAHNDFSGETYYAQYFDALLLSAPRGAVVVREHYSLDQMLEYELVARGEGRTIRGAVAPDPVVIGQMLDEGVPIYTFRRGASVLAAAGYRLEPVALEGMTLRAAIDELPGDATILVAASQRGLPVDLAPGGAARARAAWWAAAQHRAYHVAVTRAGGRDEGQFDSRDEPFEHAAAGVAGGVRIGGETRLIASAERAAVMVNGREIVAAEPGLALAALDRAGRILATWAFPPGADPRVPIDMRREPLFRVTGRSDCQPLGDRQWRDISPMAAEGVLLVNVDNYAPAVAEVLLYATADHPLAPWTAGLYDTPGPEIQTVTFDLSTPGGRTSFDRARADDGVTQGAPARAPFGARIRLTIDDRGQQASASLTFGARPVHVLARGRADRVAERRVSACTDRLPGVLGAWVPDAGDVPLGAGQYFGAGWFVPERAANGRLFRWTSSARAHTILPLGRPEPLRLRMRLLPATGVTRVDLEVNGHRVAGQALTGGWQEPEWLVPADALRAGTNHIVIVTDAVHVPAATDSDPRPRGLLVERLRLGG